MKCPNCGKEMTDLSYFVEDVYGFGDEPDYTTCTKVNKFKCKTCNISVEDDKWTVPKHLNPASEKQIRTVEWINRTLGTDCVPLLKGQCWLFISQHIKEAIAVSEHQRDEYYEWHREEYGEFEYY